MSTIDKYLKTYYDDIKPLLLDIYPELTEKNYWDEALAQTLVSEEVVQKIESETGLELPAYFKSFYTRYRSLDGAFDHGSSRMAGSIVGEMPFGSADSESFFGEPLMDYLFGQELSGKMIALKLLPFGVYKDQSYICLDMRTKPEDPPITLCSIETGEEEVENWFSSFEDYLKCMIVSFLLGETPELFGRVDPYNQFFETEEDYF